MRTRAAVLSATHAPSPFAESRPLAIEDLELQAPGPGEALVRIKAAGLCHSDLSVIDGNRPRPMPMALGHEAAGIVEEIGPSSGDAQGADLAVGDHVVCVFVPSCGHCSPCAEGRPALCEPGAVANAAGTLLAGSRRLRRRHGPPVHDLAYTITRRGGTTVTAGLPAPDKRLALPPVGLVAEERTLKGSYIGTAVPS